MVYFLRIYATSLLHFAAEVRNRKSKYFKDTEQKVENIRTFPWREGDPYKEIALKIAEVLLGWLRDEELVMISIVRAWDSDDENDDFGGDKRGDERGNKRGDSGEVGGDSGEVGDRSKDVDDYIDLDI